MASWLKGVQVLKSQEKSSKSLGIQRVEITEQEVDGTGVPEMKAVMLCGMVTRPDDPAGIVLIEQVFLPFEGVGNGSCPEQPSVGQAGLKIHSIERGFVHFDFPVLVVKDHRYFDIVEVVPVQQLAVIQGEGGLRTALAVKEVHADIDPRLDDRIDPYAKIQACFIVSPEVIPIDLTGIEPYQDPAFEPALLSLSMIRESDKEEKQEKYADSSRKMRHAEKPLYLCKGTCIEVQK